MDAKDHSVHIGLNEKDVCPAESHGDCHCGFQKQEERKAFFAVVAPEATNLLFSFKDKALY